MSRPFSYNDVNFTVIGNILFVHVKIGGSPYEIGDKIITIPPEIFKRMTTYNQQTVLSNKYTEGAPYVIGVTCNNKGDLICKSSINGSGIIPRYILTWYFLKDI